MFDQIGCRRWSLPAALWLAHGSGTCLAQGTGVIYGTVTDPSGAGVGGASVEAVLTERGTIRHGITGAAGEYVLSAMPIGTYEIRVTAAGFQQFHRQSVTLTANQNLRVDAALTVGNISESITIKAEAPLVDSRSVGDGYPDRRPPVDGVADQRPQRDFPGGTAPGASDVSAPQTFTGDRSGPTVSMSGTQGELQPFSFRRPGLIRPCSAIRA